MAVAAYGATNPAGTDPWPIESVLAKEAVSGNPSASIMLGNYQQAREADTNLYNQSMEGQHAFAKQQLADQMAQARLKLIPELVGKTGGNQFLASGGIQGIGPGDGSNPAAWAGLGTAGDQADFAKNYDLLGKGTEAFSRSGQDVALQQIPGLQNYKTTGAGQHSDITVEQIKAATALQQAAMKAKSAGAGGGTGFTVGFDVPNAYGGTDHVSANKKISDAQIAAYRASRGMKPIDTQTPAQDLPNAGNARASANSQTSLPRASGPAQNAAAGVRAVQQRVTDSEAGMHRDNPALYNDYVAGKAKNGGKPDVRVEGGKAVLYGGSGRPLAQING
jgi:hypothetical protein